MAGKKLNNVGLVVKTAASIQVKSATDKEKKNRVVSTISLKEFITEEYHFTPAEEKHGVFKCTIRDIGISPFEIDIYDARIILVEVTGKTRKDFDQNEVPERIYRGRFQCISTVLKTIGDIVASRKIMGGESTIITLRDYYNAGHSYNKYIASIVNKDYSKALDAMVVKFPFTVLSEDSDGEDWFKP